MGKMQDKSKSATGKKTKDATDTPGRHRSPNYPSIGLAEAIEFVGKLIEKDGKAGAVPEVAIRHMGFNAMHGQARAILSALRKFGLIDYVGGRVVPTDDAVNIVRFPTGHARKHASLQKAVMKPAIYQSLLARYAPIGEIPSDESLRPELVTDFDFNPKAVSGFLSDFKASLSYAGLLDGNQLLISPEAIAPRAEPESPSEEDDTMPTPQVTTPGLAPSVASAAPPRITRTITNPTPETHTGPTISFPLSRGNVIEIRMRSKVSRAEFEKVKRIFDLSEVAFVEDESNSESPPASGDTTPTTS
jgi:hypothetical protein